MSSMSPSGKIWMQFAAGLRARTTSWPDVHRSVVPPKSVRASHRARSARATLANARSWPVVRPNARLRRTQPRGFVATRASARSSIESCT